jgi:hypothetical protein
MRVSVFKCHVDIAHEPARGKSARRDRRDGGRGHRRLSLDVEQNADRMRGRQLDALDPSDFDTVEFDRCIDDKPGHRILRG